MSTSTDTKERADTLIRYIRAEVASLTASEARAALPPGSTRAKVTTANARWGSAAEERDRVGAEVPVAFRDAVRSALSSSNRSPPPTGDGSET